jgi:hypothetical protein
MLGFLQANTEIIDLLSRGMRQKYSAGFITKFRKYVIFTASITSGGNETFLNWVKDMSIVNGTKVTTIHDVTITMVTTNFR